MDIPGFYHRLYFGGGESEVRAHYDKVTVLENALLTRGTVSRRLSDGHQILSLFYLENELISCKIESDPVEVAGFYRLMMDDFNCAEHRTATRNDQGVEQELRTPSTKVSLDGGNDYLKQMNAKIVDEEDDPGEDQEEHEEEEKVNDGEKTHFGSTRTQPENDVETGTNSWNRDEDLGEGSEPQSGEEPFYGTEQPHLWCVSEDRLERQIWNETFILLDRTDSQTELVKEVKQALHFRVSSTSKLDHDNAPWKL